MLQKSRTGLLFRNRWRAFARVQEVQGWARFRHHDADQTKKHFWIAPCHSGWFRLFINFHIIAFFPPFILSLIMFLSFFLSFLFDNL